MSGALVGLGTALTFGIPAASATGLIPAWIRQGRSIGDIIPDVTIEERHNDRVQVTQHPVAIGSPVSDHAFLMPPTVTMRCGWSNANLAGTITSAIMTGSNPFGGFTETRAKEIYEKLRKLQGDASGKNPVQKVTLTTGKRTYEDMVLVDLSVTTDHTKEYSLFIEASFQQVFMVTTLTTTQPAVQNLADPGKTADTQDQSGKKPDEKPVDDRTGALRTTQTITGADPKTGGYIKPKEPWVQPPGIVN
jgi:hypothetical protein